MKVTCTQFGLRLCACLLLLAVGVGWAQMMPATPKKSEPTAVTPAVTTWQKADYAAALADFERVIKQNPDNLSLHTEFVNAAVRSAGNKVGQFQMQQRIARMVKEQAANADANKAGKDKDDAAARLPKPKSPEELAKLEKEANNAKQALEQLKALYQRWEKENSGKALYPYMLSLILDRKQFEQREQYLLQAVKLDPKFTEAYSGLASLNSGFDDHAAVQYAKKAFETKSDDFGLHIGYARMLANIDYSAGAKVFQNILSRYAGTENGANAMLGLISVTDDPKVQVPLMEQFRREYPKQAKPGSQTDSELLAAYLDESPEKALSFAQEVCKGLDPKAEREGKWWKANLDYAQARVDVNRLLAQKKFSEALTSLKDLKTPPSSDSTPLQRLKAEAAYGAGDPAKAYELLAGVLVNTVDASMQKTLVTYGARLGKNAQQVDEDIWSRRMQQAKAFADFDLRKLGGQEKVKLADLRGKVVMVSFWYPG